MVGYQKGTTDGYSAFLYKTYPSKAIDGPYMLMESPTYMVVLVSIYLLMHVDTLRRVNSLVTVLVQGILEITHLVLCKMIITVNPEVATGRPAHGTVYPTNPLWDGKGCNAGNSCCSQAGMPWFYRDVLGKINEPIEARICRDQAYSDEGILIKDLELYIQ